MFPNLYGRFAFHGSYSFHFEYLLFASRPLAQSQTAFWKTPAQGTQLPLAGNERINKSNVMATHAWD
jgi:hypothetical protein